ncbi:hypothetical protein [Pseudomonas botevensis]|uniref:hypothetical protein n=1 Tax=Pseudomonas botevensis TaxID=2842352 RepID=UPI001C3D92CA|nr:hypothetical protein [Pseudomonas botevensis]MBV4477777.1 hypothetical protein [Pseudomonas botevensis]
MELFGKAKEVASRPEVIALDSAWKHENVVRDRLEIVCAHVAKLFVIEATKQPITSSQVANESLSGGDSFSTMAPADVALLIFEVVAERNRNSQLWNNLGAGGINDEINNTVCKFLYGPSTLGGDISQRIRESTFTGAKQKLIKNLEARLF